MAAQFCRWDPDLSMVGLRFSNVMLVEDYAEFAGYTVVVGGTGFTYLNGVATSGTMSSVRIVGLPCRQSSQGK